MVRVERAQILLAAAVVVQAELLELVANLLLRIADVAFTTFHMAVRAGYMAAAGAGARSLAGKTVTAQSALSGPATQEHSLQHA
jgi:hypothetical protein